MANPWREKLGCEVNVCQAMHCDARRMVECALRKAWLERRKELETMYRNSRNEMVRKMLAMALEKMDEERKQA